MTSVPLINEDDKIDNEHEEERNNTVEDKKCASQYKINTCENRYILLRNYGKLIREHVTFSKRGTIYDAGDIKYDKSV